MDRTRHDPYRILQVDPSANPLVIQAAYRVLAQIWHPDVSGDDEQMKLINAAWEILGDPERRRAYDVERAGRHRSPAADGAGPAEPPRQAQPAASAPTARSGDHAGPPPGRPFGPVVRLGRYSGWSIGEIATVDRPYLEWLRGAPAGRGLQEDIEAVLRTRKGPGAVDERRHYETTQRQQPVHAWRPGAPTKVG